ncbi:hypothetical protein [Desulfurococcus amylolyticus]|uniref:hypothetical protein n=1 Tax=Desulfurococcus amylolyticus TaxID=94694 RepID=UPI0005B20E23|nr:hypothetical protein [Desulfurococcus amylolyticus]
MWWPFGYWLAEYFMLQGFKPVYDGKMMAVLVRWLDKVLARMPLMALQSSLKTTKEQTPWNRVCSTIAAEVFASTHCHNTLQVLSSNADA